MKKKTLSLVLALAVCLGLATPAFAANPITLNANGIYFHISDVTSSYERDTWYYDLAPGATITITEGELTEEEKAFQLESGSDQTWTAFFLTARKIGDDIYNDVLEFNKPYTCEDLNRLFQERSEEGASWETVTNFDIAVEVRTCFTDLGTIVFRSAADPDAPAPTDPGAPAYQVSNWAKDRVALAVEAGLAPEGLGNDYRVGITRAQFAAVTVKLYETMSGQKAPAAPENPFTDTEEPVILQAADLGFVSGVGGGKFDPDAPVNREQAAVMLASVYTKLGGGIPAVDATAFGDDGDISGWARNAVDFMNGKEIVTGIGDNNFGPKGGASIEQALLISLKMFEALK